MTEPTSLFVTEPTRGSSSVTGKIQVINLYSLGMTLEILPNNWQLSTAVRLFFTALFCQTCHHVGSGGPIELGREASQSVSQRQASTKQVYV